jgi:hypothetical protein
VVKRGTSYLSQIMNNKALRYTDFENSILAKSV